MRRDVMDAPDRSDDRRMHRQGLARSAFAALALAVPTLLVVALVVWGSFRFANLPADRSLDVDACQRAISCCEALEGSDDEACRRAVQLAGASSGVSQSDRSAQSEIAELCRMELRQMHAAAGDRARSIDACTLR